ncbi:hemolysin TlyA family protein [Firmicutes bacterium CAG:555]|nr:hemolysin TlyA family protein [Firmicutes bacterium CAG:555]
MKKIRLDQLVFDLGLAESRERAKTTVMSGLVFVNGQRADKPGMQVSPDVNVEVKGTALPYVSRGGLKLEKALKVFPIDVNGKVCIDCGASTGGFTDVLLKNGASKVYSVDVGYGQLAWSLRNDERVVNMERTNIRYISSEQIPEPLDICVMDLSFISVKLVLPAVCALLKDDAQLVCLIKPQFEAGREEVGKKGVVRDKAVHLSVIESVLSFAPTVGMTVMGLDFSPIKGPEGNREYLCYMKKGVHEAGLINAAAVVEASHESL